MAAAALPLDILHIILINLPAKSLQRFKTVSKSWNTIISDPHFVKTHHRNSKNSTKTQNLFLTRRGTQLCLFEFNENKSLQFIEELAPQQQQQQQQPYNGSLLWVGDGLALFSNTSNKDEKSYVLWNPSSKEQITFYCPHKNLDSHTNFGVCHDPNLDDYKVVIQHRTYYAVFSCKKRAWIKKHKFLRNTTLYPKAAAGVLVDGFSFWACKDEQYWPPEREIVYFDPRDDEFHKLRRKPELLKGSRSFYLTSLKGCLCVYDNKIMEDDSTRLRVWIMKGHVDDNNNNNEELCCWSELMNVEIVTLVDPVNGIKPMFFTEKNEGVISVYDDSGRHVVSCDPPLETHLVGRHRIHHSFPIVPYLDSLFSPIQDSTTIKPKRKRSASKNEEVDELLMYD